MIEPVALQNFSQPHTRSGEICYPDWSELEVVSVIGLHNQHFTTDIQKPDVEPWFWFTLLKRHAREPNLITVLTDEHCESYVFANAFTKPGGITEFVTDECSPYALTIIDQFIMKLAIQRFIALRA